jgi:hypothetical protein
VARALGGNWLSGRLASGRPSRGAPSRRHRSRRPARSGGLARTLDWQRAGAAGYTAIALTAMLRVLNGGEALTGDFPTVVSVLATAPLRPLARFRRRPHWQPEPPSFSSQPSPVDAAPCQHTSPRQCASPSASALGDLESACPTANGHASRHPLCIAGRFPLRGPSFMLKVVGAGAAATALPPPASASLQVHLWVIGVIHHDCILMLIHTCKQIMRIIAASTCAACYSESTAFEGASSQSTSNQTIDQTTALAASPWLAPPPSATTTPEHPYMHGDINRCHTNGISEPHTWHIGSS